MKKPLLNAALLGTTLTAAAVAPYPGPVMYTQPDGSKIEVTMKSNGNSIIYYSTANGQAMLPDKNGKLFAVTTDNGMTHLNSGESIKPYWVGLPSASVSTEGSPNVCVILVEFDDVKFSTANPQDYFNRWLNESGFTDNGNEGSVRDYFKAQSADIFTPQFNVYGPVTLSKNRSDYADESNTYKMIHEAAEALDSQIDFSSYDLNNDGKVDNVFVIFAGQGANYGATNSINPHSSDCPTDPSVKKTVDGKDLMHYACVSEQGTSTDKPDGIGTFVHEFSHLLGLPYLYNTNEQNDYTPGYWSVMDIGNYLGDGYTPCNFSAFERYSCGWLKYTELTDPAKVLLRPMADRQFACKIETGRAGDYYVLEYRSNTGWDRALYGQGMLIWHIDASDESALLSDPNNDSSHLRVDLVEADGTVGRGSKLELGGDPWPGLRQNYFFNSTTTPAMVKWNASTGPETTPVDKPVSAIYLLTVSNYVQFNFRGGSDTNIIDPDNMNYSVSVTANPSNGGTVYLGTDPNCVSLSVKNGSQVKLNAVPNRNYAFSKWTLNGEAVAYNAGPAITISEEKQGEYVAHFYKYNDEPDDYCYPTGNSTYSGAGVRGVATFTVSDNKGNSVTVDGPGANNQHPLYVDRTSSSLTTEPGATLTFDGTAQDQAWMHSYIYIDFDGNGVFDVDQSDEGINGDLVSHTGYTTSMKQDNSDTEDPTVTSDGTAVDMTRIFNLPSYTLPIDMADGTYRLRFKNDWNSTDPCGRSADYLFGGQKANFMATNGGGIIDLNLVVKSSAAIDTVENTDADNCHEPVFYNLQGMRIDAQNLTTGFYLMQQGGKTTKVFIKR